MRIAQNDRELHFLSVPLCEEKFLRKLNFVIFSFSTVLNFNLFSI